MADGCVFCAIAQGRASASIVCENELALAAIDLRQFHAGRRSGIPKSRLESLALNW
jgi:histidine triad (HIT) family protein